MFVCLSYRVEATLFSTHLKELEDGELEHVHSVEPAGLQREDISFPWIVKKVVDPNVADRLLQSIDIVIIPLWWWSAPTFMFIFILIFVGFHNLHPFSFHLPYEIFPVIFLHVLHNLFRDAESFGDQACIQYVSSVVAWLSSFLFPPFIFLNPCPPVPPCFSPFDGPLARYNDCNQSNAINGIDIMEVLGCLPT